MAERKPPEGGTPEDRTPAEDAPAEKTPPGSAAEIPTADGPAEETPPEEPPPEAPPPVEEPPPDAPPPEAPPPMEEPPVEEPPTEIPPPADAAAPPPEEATAEEHPPEAAAQEPPAAAAEQSGAEDGERAEAEAATPARPLAAPPGGGGGAPDEEDEEEEEEPVTYPLPFLKVLFSFRGRLHRKPFWLKGVLPIFVISFVVQGIISGIAAMVVGVNLLQGADFGGPGAGWTPESRFLQAGEVTVGRVGADTGPARIQVEIIARGDTPAMNKTVVLGGRRLQVTAAKRAGEDEIAYDVDLRWENYPVGVEAPASALELAFEGLAFAVALFFLWPWFAIAVKRYHDRDKSGWWSLIGLVPLVGQLWLLVVLGFLKGTEGENRFGPDPLAAEGAG